jgi:enoyl-CoA hydratase
MYLSKEKRMTTPLLLDMSGPIATLEFNRPETGNAFDAELHSAFSAALKALRNNPEIRVILLTGAGRMFCSGGDLTYIRELRSNPQVRDGSWDEGMGIVECLTDMPVPVIAAVHGHAMGLGATIMSLCDISVAWKDAKIADPHVVVGLVAGDGGAIGWSSAIGLNRAKRYLLTGETITGTKAYELGLVTDLADTPEDARTQARALAERIASLPPMAVQGTKRAFNALSAVRNGDAQRIAFAAEQATMMSEDCAEAMEAMEEKRVGVFHNR